MAHLHGRIFFQKMLIFPNISKWIIWEQGVYFLGKISPHPNTLISKFGKNKHFLEEYAPMLRSGGFTGNVTVVSSDNGKSFVYFGRMNWSVFSKLMRDSRDRSLAHELIIPYNYNKRLNR